MSNTTRCALQRRGYAAYMQGVSRLLECCFEGVGDFQLDGRNFVGRNLTKLKKRLLLSFVDDGGEGSKNICFAFDR